MIRKIKKITSGYFTQSFEDRSELSSGGPQKSLVSSHKRSFGRDNTGSMSIRHRGAGVKKRYRIISSLDEFKGMTAKVTDLQYDPNRSANIALLELNNGSKKYIIAPAQLKRGDEISFKESSNVNTGDRAMLKNIPVGSQVHNIEITPGSKGCFARSAGTFATLMAIEDKHALLRMPSGELRNVNESCLASAGQVSNIDHGNIKIGMAGRNRRKGIRPSVRGKAMNPNSHPHGGGEGVNPIGLKYPKTPWGKIAIGKKTRKKKNSDKLIVKTRAHKKR